MNRSGLVIWIVVVYLLPWSLYLCWSILNN